MGKTVSRWWLEKLKGTRFWSGDYAYVLMQRFVIEGRGGGGGTIRVISIMHVVCSEVLRDHNKVETSHVGGKVGKLKLFPLLILLTERNSVIRHEQKLLCPRSTYGQREKKPSRMSAWPVLGFKQNEKKWHITCVSIMKCPLSSSVKASSAMILSASARALTHNIITWLCDSLRRQFNICVFYFVWKGLLYCDRWRKVKPIAFKLVLFCHEQLKD